MFTIFRREPHFGSACSIQQSAVPWVRCVSKLSEVFERGKKFLYAGVPEPRVYSWTPDFFFLRTTECIPWFCHQGMYDVSNFYLQCWKLQEVHSPEYVSWAPEIFWGCVCFVFCWSCVCYDMMSSSNTTYLVRTYPLVFFSCLWSFACCVFAPMIIV